MKTQKNCQGETCVILENNEKYVESDQPEYNNRGYAGYGYVGDIPVIANYYVSDKETQNENLQEEDYDWELALKNGELIIDHVTLDRDIAKMKNEINKNIKILDNLKTYQN